jgi:SNF2 family DNA or RNA helicase
MYENEIPNLKIDLQPFQKKSLNFLLDRENSKECMSAKYYHKYLFGDGTPYFVCAVGDSPLLLDLPDVRGGFLSDEMVFLFELISFKGLGKSIEIISLLLVQGCRNSSIPSIIKEGIRTFHTGGTLIVTPPTILLQWINEINKNVEKDKIKYYVYHGSSRNRNPEFLASFDVVFTTYSVLSSDHRRHRQNVTLITDPIKDIVWNRVILDESHYVKAPKSAQNESVSNIRGRFRWCVSGTPIQTDISDLLGQFKFLYFVPFNRTKFVKANSMIQV